MAKFNTRKFKTNLKGSMKAKSLQKDASATLGLVGYGATAIFNKVIAKSSPNLTIKGASAIIVPTAINWFIGALIGSESLKGAAIGTGVIHASMSYGLDQKVSLPFARAGAFAYSESIESTPPTGGTESGLAGRRRRKYRSLSSDYGSSIVRGNHGNAVIRTRPMTSPATTVAPTPSTVSGYGEDAKVSWNDGLNGYGENAGATWNN